MKRGFILGAAVALLAVAAVLFVSNRRGTPAESAAPAPVVANAPAEVAPDFSVIDLEGKVVRLSDLRGQPVIVNFWATWCPPCRAEIPAFIDLQRKYGPQGLRIVGIAMDDGGHDVVARYAQAHGINYVVALPNPDVVQRYGGVDNLPTTFYIGRDGRIVQSVTGLISADSMEDNVRAALATSAKS